MTTPINTLILRAHGELLMRIEGAEYIAIAVVYRVTREGEFLYYCARRDWEKTDAGRIAGLLGEVERLRARVQELEIERLPVADLPDPPAFAPPRALFECCGKRFLSQRALDMHQRRSAVHKGEVS